MTPSSCWKTSFAIWRKVNSLMRGGQGRTGDRLYNCFHDHLAGRCFYSCALHDRDARTAIARIFCDHLRSDPGFRVYLLKSYPDVVQPLSPSTRPRETWLAVSLPRALPRLNEQGL